MNITLCDWDDEAARQLGRSVDGGLDWLEREVTARRMILFAGEADGVRWGTLAMRFSEGLFGIEATIVAAGAERSPTNWTKSTMPIWEKSAKRLGADCLRIHTRRPGQMRQLERLGFDGGERVFTKVFCNG